MPELEEAVIESPEVEAQETPEVEAETVETPEVAEDEPAVEGEATEDTEETEEGKEQVGADGRRMPDGLKKAFSALKATNPEAAKELKGVYFANQEYRNAFPTVADATAAKNIIEEIGGP